MLFRYERVGGIQSGEKQGLRTVALKISARGKPLAFTPFIN